MRRYGCIVLLMSLLLLALGSSALVMAQEEKQPTANKPDLLLFTKYPSQVIGIGETLTLNLNLRTGQDAQIVDLEVKELPEDWTATFRGNGRIIQEAFVDPEADSSVELRVEPPADVQPGVYRLVAAARGDGVTSELPIELTVQEKVPARLALEVDLPTLRGKPSTTFRYNVTLKNEGDDDLTVNLLAQAPQIFNVTFSLSGQDVTSIPVEANGSKRLSVAVEPVASLIPAGSYPITIQAQSGEVSATLDLAAEVIGQPTLTLTTSDERLSGEAEVGSEAPLKLVLKNTGSAAARAVKLSASSPSGWTVVFEPDQLDAIEPAQQAEINARLKPSDKAIAGDYVVTFRAQPEDGSTESVEYRVTVRTPTLWGVAGVALIAVAVGVVGLAVTRFGRR